MEEGVVLRGVFMLPGSLAGINVGPEDWWVGMISSTQTQAIL